MGHGENWKDRLLWILGGAVAALVVMGVAGAVTHLVVKDPESSLAADLASGPGIEGEAATSPLTPTTTTGKGSGKHQGETTTSEQATSTTSSSTPQPEKTTDAGASPSTTTSTEEASPPSATGGIGEK